MLTVLPKAENGNTFSSKFGFPTVHPFWKRDVSSTQYVDLNLPGFWSAVKHVLYLLSGEGRVQEG